jgi:hypothetical protein
VPISKLILSVVILLASSSVLLSTSPAAHSQVPKGDVYFGFSRTGNDTFYSNVGGLNGWEGAMHVKLRTPFLGVEGDVSHYGLGANSTIPRSTVVMFGPRFTLGALGPKVFAHALIGGEYSANSGGPTPISASALTWALGGGLDVPFAPFFAWRVAGDYLKAPTLSPRGVSPSPRRVSVPAWFSGFETSFRLLASSSRPSPSSLKLPG